MAERKLSQSDRDTLYLGKVNPLASFPGSGVVAYGQKTLQTKASALDRVNVRRLLINLKNFIGDQANTAKEEVSTLVGKVSESQARAMELFGSSKTLYDRASKSNGKAMELRGAAVALQSCAWTSVRANKLDLLLRKFEWTSADLRAVNLELQKTPKKAAWLSGDLRALYLDQLFIFSEEVPDASGRVALKPEELLRLDEVSRPLLCLPALLLGANAHD